MAITITPEQVEFLTSKGVTKEQMQSDIAKFREQGMADDEIQDSLYSHIESMGFDPNKQKRNYNPPVGELPPVPTTSQTPDNVTGLIQDYNANNPPPDALDDVESKNNENKQFLDDMNQWQDQYQKDTGVKPLQATIKKTGRAEDTAKGYYSGLNRSTRVISNIINDKLFPLADSIARKLSGYQGESFNPLSNLDKIIQNTKYSPQTIWGDIGNFAGEMTPYLLLPEAKLFEGAGAWSKLGNLATTGAYQAPLISNIENLANNGRLNTGLENLQQLGMGAGVGLGLGTVGQIFEKGLAPLGGAISGVDQQSIKRALQANSEGRSIFSKDINLDNLNKLGNEVGTTSKELDSIATLPYSNVRNDLDNIVGGYSVSNEINPVADSLKGELKKLYGWLDKYSPQESYATKDGTPISSKDFDELFGDIKNVSGGEVKPSALHDIKQYLYDNVSFDKTKGFKKTDKENAMLKEIADYLNQSLRDLSPDYAGANDEYSQMIRDLQAKADFNGLLKTNSPYAIARLSAPLFGSFAVHNPSFMAAELMASPKLNQLGLMGYENLSKIPQSAFQTGLQQGISKKEKK